MSFSLIYICCSFRVCCSLILFLFSSFSSILFLTLPVLLCLFHWSISAVVSGEAFYVLFSHCSHMFLTRREPGVPLSLFRPYPLPFSPPFLLYCSLITPFLLCFFHWSISAVAFPGRHSICWLSAVFPTVAICFWPAGNLECPCLFSGTLSSSLFSSFSSILFLNPQGTWSYSSFSSMFLFHWSISAVVSGEAFYLLIICCFPHCSHMFLTRREPGVPLSLFRSYPLPFSPSFLLYCSLITLPFLLWFFHWSISAVVSGEAFYLLFSPL